MTGGQLSRRLRWEAKLLKAYVADTSVLQRSMRVSRDGPLVLKQVRVVDPADSRKVEGASDIRIEKGRITQIAPAGEMELTGIMAIDGANRFVLPGLIDCHVHICGIFVTELPGITDLRWMLKQVVLNHRAQLQSGVTLARDMMSPLRISLLFRSLAEDPFSGFPRVLCAGPMLTVDGGYPPYIPKDRWWQRPLVGPLRLDLRDTGDAKRWVDRLAQSGVDWIKIGYQSLLFDVARSPMRKPSRDLICAISDRAHHHGLPVAVHHYWLQDLQDLLELPLDTLEHIIEDGPISPAMLDKIAERNLGVTTDLEQSAFANEPQKYLDRIENGHSHLLPRPKQHIERLLREVAAGEDIYGLKPRRMLMELAFVKDLVYQKMENLRRLVDHNILVGAATDSGVHMLMGMLPEELCRMKQAGLSNAQVLRAATLDAAKLLRVDDVGQIKEGFRADLVLYESNPLENIETVREPALVLRDGVPHPVPNRDGNPIPISVLKC